MRQIQFRNRNTAQPWEKVAPMTTPRTKKAQSRQDAPHWIGGDNVVCALFAAELEIENEEIRHAVKLAIEHILENGGHEEWPIVKRLRSALLISHQSTRRD